MPLSKAALVDGTILEDFGELIAVAIALTTECSNYAEIDSKKVFTNGAAAYGMVEATEIGHLSHPLTCRRDPVGFGLRSVPSPAICHINQIHESSNDIIDL